ncbi:MAG: EAL domain-containing protein [Terracidiphilus sp.]
MTIRTSKQRIYVALAATLIGAACGTLCGLWIGRVITLQMILRGLGHEAARNIDECDTYARDVHAALDAMNAAHYPYCSVEDMEFLRGLLYHSTFLKEIGRIRDNKIACSTTHRPQPPSGIELPNPDSIGTDGVKVYRNSPLFRMPKVAMNALQAGDSYVVLYPYFDSLREHNTVRLWNTTVGRAEKNLPALGEGGWARPSEEQLTKNSDFRIGDVMYATRCSSLSIDNICATASLTVTEGLQLNRREMKVFHALSGLMGACFGFIVILLYQRNRSMEQQLRRAIRRDKLSVVYQPIVSLSSGSIVGGEALARWTDEDGFAVGPDIFINVAEERGFVGEITRLVARHALNDFAATLRANPDFHLSINVAAADLADPEFLPMLESELERTGVRAESLSIEITESSTARQDVAIATIQRLHACGHSVHIDDFGTGYSSLSYLHDLSVNAIKIDRSFTQAIGTEAVTLSILPQILAMAESLHLQVIVEGIETRQQANYFTTGAKGILGQGWLFGRPVPGEEFRRLLAEDGKEEIFLLGAA